MIPIRLDAIRRLIPVHIVVTEHTKRLQLAWNPESTLIISAINMDKTYDFTKHPAVTSNHINSVLEDSATNPEKLLDTYSFAPDFQALVANNPEKLLDTYSFAPDFQALVANNPRCHAALCALKQWLRAMLYNHVENFDPPRKV